MKNYSNVKPSKMDNYNPYGPQNKKYNTFVMLLLMSVFMICPFILLKLNEGVLYFLSISLLSIISFIGFLTLYHLLLTKHEKRPKWLKDGFVRRKHYLPKYIPDMWFGIGALILIIAEQYILFSGMVIWIVVGVYTSNYMHDS